MKKLRLSSIAEQDDSQIVTSLMFFHCYVLQRNETLGPQSTGSLSLKIKPVVMWGWVSQAETWKQPEPNSNHISDLGFRLSAIELQEINKYSYPDITKHINVSSSHT